MPKPAAWRTAITAYPFSGRVETRFQDLDPLGHINNVAMAALFETGRVRFNRSMGTGLHTSGERWLIVALSINYLAEAHFPADVTIASGIGEIGRSSWTIVSAAFQEGLCVATSDSTLVLTTAAGPQPIGEGLRTALEANRVIGG